MNIKNGEIEKSAVAAYVQTGKQAMDCKPVLLKQVLKRQNLTS